MATVSPKSFIYVVYGSEDYHLDELGASVRAWPNRDLRRLNLSEPTPDTAVLDLCVGNIDGTPITVLIDDAGLVKESKSKALRSFIDSRSPTDTSLSIVAIVREAKLSGLWEYAATKGKVTPYQKLSAFGETESTKKGKGNEVLKYIRERATNFGLSFEDGANLIFFKWTGGDLHRINSEFRKLKILASVTGKHKITVEILKNLVANNLEVGPWLVAESAFNKDKVKAMNRLSLIFETEKEDEASVRITSALIRELQSVIFARHLVDSGMTSAEISTVLEMHPWKCSEIFLPKVRKHDQRSLAGHMTRLCRLDSEVKSKSISKRTLVELAVLSISC